MTTSDLASQPRSGVHDLYAGRGSAVPANPRKRKPVYTPPSGKPRRRTARPEPADADTRPLPAAEPADTEPAEPAEEPAQKPAGTSPASGPPAIGGPSGAILALFLYPMTFALLRGGPAEMWGWIKAKFFNEPYGGSGPGPGSGGKQSGGRTGLGRPRESVQ